MDDRVGKLASHFELVLRERMRGLPIVNPDLEVEAVGFRKHSGHVVGVLVTPWFMNLVLLPGTEEYASLSPGETVTVASCNESVEFTVTSDDAAGSYLTAVLFRSMGDFPDQATARAVAGEVMHLLLDENAENRDAKRRVSRRDLFRAAG